jgi:hypothetical protein
MTLITRAQLPVSVLPTGTVPAGQEGSIEQLFAFAAAAMRFHTLSLERIQLVDALGAVTAYRPCTINPVETPDKKLMLFVQGIVPLVVDPYSSTSTAIWQDVSQLPSSAVLTAAYKAAGT